jgi:holliday junction DNA helicase RuvB
LHLTPRDVLNSDLERPMPENRDLNINDTGPNVLERMIGQSQVVQTVRVALEASWNDGTRFPDAGLFGPAGVGKSTLCSLIARELGSPLHETLAQTLTSPGDLHALLMSAADRDVVFIDECDEMDGELQTLLYRAIAERKLFLPRGSSPRTPPAIPLANFTMLMACNHESRLAQPLVQRLKLVCRFGFYDANEIERILSDRVRALRWSVADGVLAEIAKRARGVPRIALRHLEAAHRVSRAENEPIITRAHFDRMCQLEGLDAAGLDPTEQQYLRILHGAAGKPLRLGVIADRLGLPSRTLSISIEPFLVRTGLIYRSDAGRELSSAGRLYVEGENTGGNTATDGMP